MCGARACAPVVAHRLAAIGMALTGVMQSTFLATSFDRPAGYAALQVAALFGSVAAAVGLWRFERRAGIAALGAGLLVQGAVRAIMLAAGYSRLAAVINLAMVAGFAIAGAVALLWATRPSKAPDARAAGVRAGLSLVGLAYFAGMVSAVSGGRLSALLAMAVGTIGWALAAPNVEALPEHAAWTRGERGPASARADDGADAA